MAAGLAFKVAKGVVVKGFWLSLLPLTETVRLSRKRPISQPFFMGSIDQWNKDVTLPITDDGEVVAEVSFDLNRSAIATTGGIAGVGYMVSTAIFASRFQGHTRAKIANALVQKINLNVAIIQRIMDEGKTAHRVSLTAVEPVEIQIRMMQYQRYATDMRIAVDLMEDNIRHLKYANQIATQTLEGEPIAMFIGRTVELERIDAITINIFEMNRNLQAGPIPIREMAKQAYMTDAEILEFQTVVESNTWFGKNPEAQAVAAKFVHLDDALGLAHYTEEAKGMSMLLEQNIQRVQQLWNHLAMQIYYPELIGTATGEVPEMVLRARGHLMTDLGNYVVEDVYNTLHSAQHRIWLNQTAATSQELMTEAFAMAAEVSKTGAIIEKGVLEADRLAFAAGTGRSLAWIYRFAPRVASGLAIAGRFAGWIAIADLALWVGTGLLIDLPLNLFMDEEDQGFFADRAGFTFIGEALEWVILEGFNAIWGEEAETLYEAFLTMIASAILTDDYPLAAEIIFGWYVDNITVELMVPLSFPFENSYEMPSIILGILDADPLAILELFLYAIVAKIVFTHWLVPTWLYMAASVKPSL